MNSIAIRISILITLATASCQAPSPSSVSDSKTVDSNEGRMVTDIAAASRLARWGRDNNSALALAAAAAVLRQTPTGGTAPSPSNPRTNDTPKAGGSSPATADSLLTEARRLAGGDAATLSIIDRSLESARGREGGPGQITTRVGAMSEDYYDIRFLGGQVATIAVDGDRDTDLDLYVYDSNSNLVASDTDSTDLCVVNWLPRKTGNFRVVVRNLGRVYNLYRMTTN